MARISRLRRSALVALGALSLLASAVSCVGCALSAPGWRGPATDHFDGSRFVTPGATAPHRDVGDFLKWAGKRDRGPWREFHQEPSGPPPPRQVGAGELRVTFINHATTLIQLDGVNVLTDPIYSDRCSPVDFAGPARVRPPGIRFEDLPRIDVVVLSHNHYDHFDLPTLKRIAATWPAVRFFTGLGNRALLEKSQIQGSTELDWWESREVGGVTVRSVPVQHFSNRGMFDADRSLWTGWSLESPSGRTFFAGDTGYGPHFAQAAQKLGPFRLAVLPIGAYKPEWFMGPIHMSPAQAVQAALDLGAPTAVPMHYGTFPLADDGETEAVERLAEAVKGKAVKFDALGFGQGLEVPR